jgi:Amiloride-sensitive sodium channel
MWIFEGQPKADLWVQFKVSEFYPLIRRKHFTKIDIFSFVGGLLGLFLGFSVLSAIEILHFFCINVCFKRKPFSETPKPSWNLDKRTKSFNDRCDFLANFMKKSSIAGLAYIADESIHLIERLIWFLAFLLSMVGCTLMIVKLRERLGIDTITMIMEDGAESVSNLPFPAITIVGPHERIYFYDYWVRLGCSGVSNMTKIFFRSPDMAVRIYNWHFQVKLYYIDREIFS